MKKILSVLLVCALVLGVVPLPLAQTEAQAAGDVEINKANFPDANFREYVEENFDTDPLAGGIVGDGRLTASEISEIRIIECQSKDIKNLKGIEHFTALTVLHCGGNQLTSLDVSNNTALTVLHCGDNQLPSLDVSKSKDLRYLWCWGNQLASLDVSQNTALTVLWCGGNQLLSLDVSKNTALDTLHCSDNQLTSLDVSNNTWLGNLDCANNQLASLDVSKNTALEWLSCGDNQLASLDVSKNTALMSLDCGGNQLTSLDVSNNKALWSLYCFVNQLPSLDVSKNTALTTLSCGGNQLPSLDVSKNTKLETLYCWGNQLTSLDVSNNTELLSLSCAGNPLTNLDVSSSIKLNRITVGDDNIDVVDLSKNVQLSTLYIHHELDLVQQKDGRWQIDLNEIKNHITLPKDWFDTSKLTSESIGINVDGVFEAIPDAKYDPNTGIAVIANADVLKATVYGEETHRMFIKVSDEKYIYLDVNLKPDSSVQYTVTGQIESSGGAATGITTVALYRPNETKPAYTPVEATDSYTFKNVAPGTYTMKVMKKNHVERKYTVEVNTSNVTQDVRICLLGDVTQDGKVNSTDVSRLYAHVKNINPLKDEYEIACADVIADGKLNSTDVSRLYAHAKGTSLL